MIKSNINNINNQNDVREQKKAKTEVRKCSEKEEEEEDIADLHVHEMNQGRVLVMVVVGDEVKRIRERDGGWDESSLRIEN